MTALECRCRAIQAGRRGDILSAGSDQPRGANRSMQSTERSAVLVGRRQIEMQEFPVPQAGEDDGVLEIEVTGVCGSDVFHYNGDNAPVILGHEMVGRVVDIGPIGAGGLGRRGRRPRGRGDDLRMRQVRALPDGQVPSLHRDQGLRRRGEGGPTAVPLGRLRAVRLPAADGARAQSLRGASGRGCGPRLRRPGQRGSLAAHDRGRHDRRHSGRGGARSPRAGRDGRGARVGREAHRRRRAGPGRGAPRHGATAGGDARGRG